MKRLLGLGVMAAALVGCASAPRIDRTFALGDATRVVVCSTGDAAIVRGGEPGVIRVSGRPEGGQHGYHTSDPSWRPVEPKTQLDFTAARTGDAVAIAPTGERAFIHTFFQMDDVRVEVPANVEVELAVRTLPESAEPVACRTPEG
jgi:hypothetical protein